MTGWQVTGSRSTRCGRSVDAAVATGAPPFNCVWSNRFPLHIQFRASVGNLATGETGGHGRQHRSCGLCRRRKIAVEVTVTKAPTAESRHNQRHQAGKGIRRLRGSCVGIVRACGAERGQVRAIRLTIVHARQSRGAVLIVGECIPSMLISSTCWKVPSETLPRFGWPAAYEGEVAPKTRSICKVAT